jgi:hypothetical protein
MMQRGRSTVRAHLPWGQAPDCRANHRPIVMLPSSTPESTSIRPNRQPEI